jgi:hypothetical protein
MKNVYKMIAFLKNEIKKKFFNKGITQDNLRGCELYQENSGLENVPADEYLSNYKTTTRWQTL